MDAENIGALQPSQWQSQPVAGKHDGCVCGPPRTSDKHLAWNAMGALGRGLPLSAVWRSLRL